VGACTFYILIVFLNITEYDEEDSHHDMISAFRGNFRLKIVYKKVKSDKILNSYCLLIIENNSMSVEKITPPVLPEGRKNLFYSDYSKFLGF